VAFGFKIR